MKKILSVLILMCLLSGTVTASDWDANWPQWRGPLANGVSPNGNPPVQWSETKNIKWKVEIPGEGIATPVIWNNQIFILSAIETDKVIEIETEVSEVENQGRGGWMSKRTSNKLHKFDVISFDRKTGKINWQTTCKQELPAAPTHGTASWASNSPVTDGEHVYAYFGSHGLYCLDMKGNMKWGRDFGDLKKTHDFGEGSSPVLHKEKIFIVWDHEEASFIVALDKITGKDVWKIDRDEKTSWATPFVVEHDSKAQIITNATNKIRSYDPDTGSLIWECGGMLRNVIPMPLYAKGIVYLMSGFRGAELLAIDLAKAKGDITDTEAVVWKYNKNTPYVPSGLINDNILYFLKVNKGFLTALNAADGTVYYSIEKLEGIKDIYASLVLANGKLYITGINGVMYTIKSGPQFEIITQNSLEDEFKASPAIIGNALYLRGKKYLYRIENQ